MDRMIISATVVKGDQRGRLLGYPTINQEPKNSSLDDGIYISEASVDGRWHPSVTFVGTPRMFNDLIRKIETHILDFDQELYGQEITVRIHKKIRASQDFTDAKELIRQIEDDIRVTRNYFKEE